MIKKTNWMTSDLTAHTTESKSISKEEVQKKVASLQKKTSSLISESEELYSVAPTSELYSIINILENIIRELDKLK